MGDKLYPDLKVTMSSNRKLSAEEKQLLIV